MKNLFSVTLAAFILASTFAVEAQENDGTLTIKAQVRPRFEYNHGAQMPLASDAEATSFISNRARLSLGYDNGFLSMGVSAQDVSIWGQKPQVDNAANMTINEAWAKIRKDGYFVQIGRQQLAYDDDRILGTLDWHQAGRWHDALKLGYENLNNRLHLILAYNQTPKAPGSGTFYENGGQPYKFMQAGHYTFNNNDGFNISFLALNLGLQGVDIGTDPNIETPVINHLQTIGTNVGYKLENLSLAGTLYVQTGRNSAGTKVNAYMAAAKAGYNFSPTISGTAGIDYLSGQRPDKTETATWFNPLFGTHHKFYGAMDFFYASAYPTYGLSDIYLSVKGKPTSKLTVDLAYHYFSAQQLIRVYNTDKKSLGSEIDLTLTYPIRPYITLQGGYSVMFGTEAFFTAKGGDKNRTQHWGFLSLNINPVIFRSGK